MRCFHFDNHSWTEDSKDEVSHAHYSTIVSTACTGEHSLYTSTCTTGQK